MKSLLIALLALFLFACGSNPSYKSPANSDSLVAMDSPMLQKQDSAYDEPEADEENSIDTFYIVVTDTGKDYFKLRNQMFRLHKLFHITIDTMGRYYNKTKKEIVLREEDEDEIYRGEYFPRRFPSSSISLEYLNNYLDGSERKTIALVAGIYETRPPADSARQVLLKTAPRTFVLKSAVYTGCMH
jgi:hypothetical protein